MLQQQSAGFQPVRQPPSHRQLFGGTIKDNGGTKTEKTEDNILKFMRYIVNMPNRKNVKWFDDGMYQAGSDRELLKRSQDLKNQGKNLFIENQKEDLELSEYKIAVEEHNYTKAKYLCKNRPHLQEMVMEVPSWKDQCNERLLRTQE